MSFVQGTDGNLYGTTSVGGSNGAYGSVFEITPAGTLTTLHSFAGFPTEGQYPTAGLVQATDGNFYGTTESGGANFYGTVFKITSGGKLTTLYSFCAQTNCTDGGQPDGALIQATDGNFYGTTQLGGAYNYGTVFKITPNGKRTTLYSFCAQANCADGSYPNAGLIQATDGNFYGTTYGSSNGSISATIFKITVRGKLTTLHTFNGADGYGLLAPLIQGWDGNFYGTTVYGGPNGLNAGTVFKITSRDTLTTLHDFNFNQGEGANPCGGLVQATDGNFYGTTSSFGTHSGGTAFKITPAGMVTTLYNFCAQTNCTDGEEPTGALTQATSGILYGTTWYGGANGEGTVFSLSVGLRPFVETRPTAGKVGANVIILGTNLKGTTSVTFNGTAAKFTVVSKSEIKSTVPVGATSGKVKVKTRHRALVSNVPFRVIR
jgi:uncharacterized repeat protein (TIGR03803 family)